MKNLYKALADLQQEAPVILKETTGYGYQYADWPTILGVVNPLMKKYGLGFTQGINYLITGDTVSGVVETAVFHIETGEVLMCKTPIPQGVSLKGMNDFQVLGSAITYIKRYALSSLLGLVTDKDNDAHGEQVKKEVKGNKRNVDSFFKDITPNSDIL